LDEQISNIKIDFYRYLYHWCIPPVGTTLIIDNGDFEEKVESISINLDCHFGLPNQYANSVFAEDTTVELKTIKSFKDYLVEKSGIWENFRIISNRESFLNEWINSTDFHIDSLQEKLNYVSCPIENFKPFKPFFSLKNDYGFFF